MQIKNESMLFVHANMFSCKLPRHREVKPNSNASLVLIGNHFARPKQVPPWITTAERPVDMFCVSNKPSEGLVVLLMCGACLFLIAFTWIRSHNVTNKIMGYEGHMLCARSAWYQTSEYMAVFVVASCVLLPMYENAISPACVVVSDHL
eukprot:3735946-Amphidinium_carterae.1